MLQYAKKALPFVVVTVQLLAITLLVTSIPEHSTSPRS